MGRDEEDLENCIVLSIATLDDERTVCMENSSCKIYIWLIDNLQKFKECHCTECSEWKLSKVNGCRTGAVHHCPYVGKAKMNLSGSGFFQF